MKKPNDPKKAPAKKGVSKDGLKAKESGELKKPTKLKPLKEKDKKNWKNNLNDDEEEDFAVEDDIKLSGNLDDDEDEDDGYYDDY